MPTEPVAVAAIISTVDQVEEPTRSVLIVTVCVTFAVGGCSNGAEPDGRTVPSVSNSASPTPQKPESAELRSGPADAYQFDSQSLGGPLDSRPILIGIPQVGSHKPLPDERWPRGTRSAVTDTGVPGFVYNSDVWWFEARTLDRAAYIVRRFGVNDKRQIVVPVYAADGKTRIGTRVAATVPAAVWAKLQRHG